MELNLNKYNVISLDTETTGLQWWNDRIFGVSLSTDIQDYYWDVRETPNVLPWLNNELKNYDGLLVFQNAKYDTHFFREAGVTIPMKNIEDTMIMAALLDEHRLKYDLDSLGVDYLGIKKMTDIYEELSVIFGGKPTAKTQMPNLHRAPKEIASKYAKQDTNLTLKLWHLFKEMIQEQNLSQCYKIEMELLEVLVGIEYRGINVNISEAERAAEDIDELVEENKAELNKIAGFPINPNPSGSIHKLFQPEQDKKGNWILIDGTVAGTTGAGKASINADVLRKMNHPASDLILDIRQMNKTRDTFIKGHILGHHNNGVIHANFNQTRGENEAGTGTGRLSVNNPALQQIPKREKRIAAIVRSLFLPDKGQVWNCRDWSQMDFRVFAHYLQDSEISKRYHEDPESDFHQIASDITGLPRSPSYSGEPNAKQINLGLVFGMGAGTLAEKMNLPFTYEEGEKGYKFKKPGKEAEEVFKKYHLAIPGVSDLLNRASSVAKSRGYVKTVIGRRIRFPEGKFTHKAGGLIFQGSAADALKVKLIEVYKELKNTEGRLLLNVHDEFDCSMPKGDDNLNNKIKEIVHDFGKESRIHFTIPIRSDFGEGSNWWEAC